MSEFEKRLYEVIEKAKFELPGGKKPTAATGRAMSKVLKECLEKRFFMFGNRQNARITDSSVLIFAYDIHLSLLRSYLDKLIK